MQESEKNWVSINCFVAIPAGGEKAREKAIPNYLKDGQHLIRIPAEQYTPGFPAFLREFLPKHKDYFFLNHSMGNRSPQSGEFTNNEVTLKALEAIAHEVKRKVKPHYFIPAVGNGSSVLGPARALGGRTKAVAFETFQSAVAHSLKHPGNYEKQFGIRPGTLSCPRLPGTS